MLVSLFTGGNVIAYSSEVHETVLSSDGGTSAMSPRHGRSSGRSFKTFHYNGVGAGHPIARLPDGGSIGICFYYGLRQLQFLSTCTKFCAITRLIA